MRVSILLSLAVAALSVDTAHRVFKSRVPKNFDPVGCEKKLQELCGQSKSPEEMGGCATTNEASLVSAGCLSKEAVTNCRAKAEQVCPPGSNPDPKVIFGCLQKNRNFLEGAGCPVPPENAAPVEANAATSEKQSAEAPAAAESQQQQPAAPAANSDKTVNGAENAIESKTPEAAAPATEQKQTPSGLAEKAAPVPSTPTQA
uniref:Uncharacterized protein n=1 Tax=Lotharella oceanica TaxID=641309 RepID=A0A7S2XFB7_9EUKA|mmetsp:Transcript_36978/g.68248  ORF Transcript_36978/g.68248 Transcript_36978/m.68248 type:complete len:202 (+) Transcript_36978:16-621(+)